MHVPPILIPKRNRELFKQLRYPYKLHYKMMAKLNATQQQSFNHLQIPEQMTGESSISSLISNNDSTTGSYYSTGMNSNSNGDELRICHFDKKPLGFQISCRRPYGIFVTKVYHNTPAFKKGIQPGWIVMKVNDARGDIQMMNQLRKHRGSFTIMFNDSMVHEFKTLTVKKSDAEVSSDGKNADNSISIRYEPQVKHVQMQISKSFVE